MSRFQFGGGTADYVADSNGRPRSGVTVTFYDAETGGSQLSDLLDADGAAVGSVTSGAGGRIPRFSGPDGVTELWAEAGGAYRSRMDAYDDEGATDVAVAGLLGSASAARDAVDARVTTIGNATYEAPAVIAPVPTGVAATDTAALQTAIDATPAGGRLRLPTGTYVLNAALVVAENLTIEGDSVGATFDRGDGSPSHPGSPYLTGTVLKQTAAATNIIESTQHNLSLNLSRLGLLFEDGLASTGHGIYLSPALAQGAGHYPGPVDFDWSHVYIHGHDGDHYGVWMLNPLYGTLYKVHSFGGGGFMVVADAGTINSGNLVLFEPYASVFNAGTADAYAWSAASTSAHPGQLNFVTVIRPQGNISEAAYTAGTQKVWNDSYGAGEPSFNTVIAPDLEASRASRSSPCHRAGRSSARRTSTTTSTATSPAWLSVTGRPVTPTTARASSSPRATGRWRHRRLGTETPPSGSTPCRSPPPPSTTRRSGTRPGSS